LSSPTAKTAGRISSINTPNDAFSAKDVPFGCEKIEIKYLTDLFKKNYNGAYGENL